MALDATIKILEEQNAILDSINESSTRLKAIDTRLMNEHQRTKKIDEEQLRLGQKTLQQDTKSKLADKEEEQKRNTILQRMADGIKGLGNVFTGAGKDKGDGGGGLGGLLGRVGKIKAAALGVFTAVVGSIFAVITAIVGASGLIAGIKAFNDKEGSLADKIGAGLLEFGATVLDMLLGWIPKSIAKILELFGADEETVKKVEEFSIKDFIKSLPEKFTKFVEKIQVWFDEYVMQPINNFIEGETFQTALVTVKIMKNIFMAIPTFIDNAITMMMNGVKNITASIVKFLDGIKFGGKTINLGFKKFKTPEISLGDVVPDSVRAFAESPDDPIKEIDIMEGVDFSGVERAIKIQQIKDETAAREKMAAAANTVGPGITQSAPIIIAPKTNNANISAPTTTTNIAAETESVEKAARGRRSGVGSR